MLIDDRPTIASPDDDPYLWLEQIEGERALAFVAQQSKLTLERFGDAGFADDRDTLTAIYDRPDNIPYVTRRGGFLYNLWKSRRGKVAGNDPWHANSLEWWTSSPPPVHNFDPLPIVLAGGASGRLKGGRHIRHAPHTPLREEGRKGEPVTVYR